MTRVYIALRDRKPTDNSVTEMTSKFGDIISVDQSYSGVGHTLLRCDDAENLPQGFDSQVAGDYKGAIFPGTNNGQWARDWLDSLTSGS